MSFSIDFSPISKACKPKNFHSRYLKLLFSISLAVFLVPALGSLALGQGLLVDLHKHHHHPLPRPVFPTPTPPPSSYKIKSIDINVALKEQIAKVEVSQTFVNTGSQAMEVSFIFPLPYDGAVDRLTFMVDGKEMEAKLLPAKEARSLYESIVRKNKDPALLEWMGTGLFKTSVFPVPPGEKRTVSLRYSQICRKTYGLTDFVFPLSTAKYTSHALEALNIRVTVDSNTPIKNIYSPSHAIEIKRPTETQAVLTLQTKNQIPTADFRLLYDVGKDQLGANLISYRPNPNEDGYFLLLATPPLPSETQERPKKNVIFVVDRSGSMSGKKIEQAKGALKFVLNNLREGDAFNIIGYDSEIETFQPELQKFNEATRAKALGFVEGLYAGGSTNIDAALKRAMSMLKDNDRPSYIIFLTDGLPTAGETNATKIVVNAKKLNAVRARLFAFGVGYDVNSLLLDKLVSANFGQSEYVQPNQDIEAAVSSFYKRIGSPVLTDVSFRIDLDGLAKSESKATSRVYPKGTFDLFAGQQLLLVGRYKPSGAAKIHIEGTMGNRSSSLFSRLSLFEKAKIAPTLSLQKFGLRAELAKLLTSSI